MLTFAFGFELFVEFNSLLLTEKDRVRERANMGIAVRFKGLVHIILSLS